MSACTCGHGFAKNERFCPRCGSLRPDAPAAPPPAPASAIAAGDNTRGSGAMSNLSPSRQAGPAGITEARSGLPNAGPTAPQPVPTADGRGEIGATSYAQQNSAPEASKRAVNTVLLREGCGVLLLLGSFFQSWSIVHTAGWPVSVLVTLAALAMPVLNHLGRLTSTQSRPSRGLLLFPAAPMALLVLFTTIRELTEDDLAGAGLALAACGVLLILQSTLPDSTHRAEWWLRIGLGLLGVTALRAAYSVIQAIVDYGRGADAYVIATIVLFAVYGIGLPGWFMIRTAKRSSADWAAGILLGIALLVGLMRAGSSPAGLFFATLAMGLVALSDASVLSRMHPPLIGANWWLLPARGMVTFGGLTFGYLALARLAGLLTGYNRSAASALALVICLGMATFAFACRSHANRGSAQTRAMVVGWSGAALVLSLINLSLSSKVRLGGPLSMKLWTFVAPLLIAGAVTAPASVRQLGSLHKN